jgi:hypothetical protein
MPPDMEPKMFISQGSDPEIKYSLRLGNHFDPSP